MLAAVLYLVFVVLAVAIMAARARRARLERVARARPDWGVPHVAEADPYADEYWRFVAAAREAEGPGVDDRTWSDLDIDAVIQRIDRTRSTLGRQMLYWRLRLGTDAPQRDRLRAIEEVFARDPAARAGAVRAFDTLDPLTGQGFWRITRPRAIELKSWYYVFPILTAMTVVSAIATLIWPSYAIVLGASLVLNLFARAATARDMIGYRGAFSQVAPIIRIAQRLLAAVPAGGEDVARDIGALTVLRRPARWMSRDPHQAGEFAATAYEYLNVILVIDANALLVAAKVLEQSRDALIRVSEWVGDVDVALSVASVRAEARSWCLPVEAGDDLSIADAWHPMLSEPVSNSISLAPGEGIIVTGSNMSGKSTLLRTAGVCVVLANGLRLAPAASFVSGPIRVRSCIGRADSIAEGRSYYLTEVETVLDLLRTAERGGRHLFLFDELFRGTNTVERIAAGEAVLRALVRTYDGTASSVVVATHDGELVDLLADAYRPVHFQEQTTRDGLAFDYRLREGPAATRSAITLLELYGAPDDVVAAARARADQLDARD